MAWAAVGSAVVGGLLGSDGSSQSQSTQQTLDPRMEGAVYGAGGVVPQAQAWYKANESGLNSQMLTGLDNSWAQLGNSKQGFDQMQNLGMGLLGGGAAANPFASGYQGGGNFQGSTNGQGGSIASKPMSYQPTQMNQPGPFSQQFAVDQVARIKAAEDARIAAAKAEEERRLANMMRQAYGYGGNDSGGNYDFGGGNGYGGGDQTSGDGGGNPGGSGTDSSGSGYA